MTNKHAALEAPETMADRFRDAVAPRTLLLGVGVLLLQFGFILSYIGAFHAPAPHRIPVTVVAPAQAGQQFVDRLNAIAGEPVAAGATADEGAARDALRTGATSAVYVVNAGGAGGHPAGRVRRRHIGGGRGGRGIHQSRPISTAHHHRRGCRAGATR